MAPWEPPPPCCQGKGREGLGLAFTTPSSSPGPSPLPASHSGIWGAVCAWGNSTRRVTLTIYQLLAVFSFFRLPYWLFWSARQVGDFSRLPNTGTDRDRPPSAVPDSLQFLRGGASLRARDVAARCVRWSGPDDYQRVRRTHVVIEHIAFASARKWGGAQTTQPGECKLTRATQVCQRKTHSGGATR